MAVTAKEIDALLPQTQCGDCGYGGCMPYATAMANQQAPINLCPPGGTHTLKRLADLLGQSTDQYIDDFISKPTTVAVINEELCIGCTKCIQACPVDAIIGAAKVMHTVISDQCTGCNLCVEPCPMDCIAMPEITALTDKQQAEKANASRQRYQAHNLRLQRWQQEQIMKHQQAKLAKNKQNTDKKAAIAAAVARAKAKRN